MGLLDAFQQQPQQAQGGLLGAMPQGAQGTPQAGAAPAGGQMPEGMAQAVEQMRGADPESKQAFIQDVTQKLQSSGRDPQLIAQVLQQFLQAMQS